MGQNMSHQLVKASLIILLIYIAPVFFILTGLLSFEQRFYLLELATILVILSSLITQIKLSQLGFTRKKLGAALRDISQISLSLALSIIFIYILGGVRIDNSTNSWGYYLFFVFISSPSQEILYRGYLFHLFSEAGWNRLTKIALSSFLYSFVYLIYLDVPTLVITHFFFRSNITQRKNSDSFLLPPKNPTKRTGRVFCFFGGEIMLILTPKLSAMFDEQTLANALSF